MHIKQLTVHGFKSYRDETIFGPFSPHHNVIVGRNGSGKSNFFAAIRFVLHDAYTRLGQEERQALLHEGGTGHLAAYVEIVFDNAEGRFPTGRDTTTLRRTVGLKKDEYSLDGRPATKTDVLNLLQSAGFSRSNPYYIVPQGRVTALTNAKDAERLALLKEVAGTRTYEEHREESLKILEETRGKREKIQELLVFIEERLGELEEERRELAAFQSTDRERRTIEYVLEHRALVEVGEELSQLENENEGLAADNATTIAAFDSLLAQIGDFEGQLAGLRKELGRAEEELRMEEEQRMQLLQDEARLKLQLEELQTRHTQYGAEETQLQMQLEKVNGDIAIKEDAVADAQPKLKASEEQEQDRRMRLDQMEGRREALQTKQGRSVQFRSAGERDRWLRREIETMEGQLGEVHRKQAANLRDELESAKIRQEDLVEAVRRLEREEGDTQMQLGRLDEEIDGLRRRRDHLTEQRKELWRAEHKLEGSLTGLREEVGRLEQVLLGSLDRGTLQGLEAVRRIAAQYRIEGVHGPLYELIQVEDVYRVAVEAVAGNSLFHVLVEDEAVASRLLEVMIRERSGRVTFMPLNRLHPTPASYPTDRAEAIPLVEVVQCEERYTDAVKQVFGRAVLCQELSSGATLARKLGLTAVTLGGDRADRKGALSGGFLEAAASAKGVGGKLDTAARLRSWQQKLREHEALLHQVQHKLHSLEPEITGTLAQLEQIQCRREQLLARGDTGGGGISELMLRRRELAALEELMEIKRRALRSAETQQHRLTTQINALCAELGTPLTSQLSAAEQAELQQLVATIDAEREASNQSTATIAELAGQVAAWENELDADLRRRRHELVLRLGAISTQSLQRELRLAEAELAGIQGSLASTLAAIATYQEEVKSLATTTQTISSALDQARAQYDEAMRAGPRRHAAMEKYLTRRMALLDRRDTLQRKLRELAVTPDAPVYAQLRDAPAPELLRRLHLLNEELRGRFAHVNKKAHEQHSSFYRQGETLRERQRELEASAQAIDEFIRVLDRRKDEAIDRTFQQVAKSFAEVFEALVPAGRGELVMVRNLSPPMRDALLVNGALDDSAQAASEDADHFTGVAIRVSFTSKHDSGLQMSQLSGGQKSLVALALIFAIQRCDPAPFYLFDEIDAALDTAHRTAVARLLAAQSNAQFLLTTFRPELLDAAQSFWGVSFGGRVSRVEAISREQALQFVENEPLALH